MLKKTRMCTAAAVLALVLPSASAPETPAAELLEEAIFLEETVGDLDAAMEIYQRIADDDAARRPLAARALYRLYRCHERRGEEIFAAVVLGQLRQRYPDYEELLAGEADLPRSPVLRDAPWLDDEVQVLFVRTPAGVEVGPLVTFAHPAVVDGEEVWRLGLRRSYGSDNQGVSVIEARRRDMIPLHSRIRRSQVGHLRVDYLPGQVVFRTLGPGGSSRDRTLAVSRRFYDSETLHHLVRLLPPEVGEKAVLPLISYLGESVDLTVEVTSRERLEVPAGTFDCYRLEAPLVGYVYHLSTGPRRELVRIEGEGVVAELAETMRRRPEEPFTYHDADLGFSVHVPAGWFTYRHPRDIGKVSLLDPDARARVALVKAFLLPGDPVSSARTLAEGTIRRNRRKIAGLRIRDDSWEEWRSGGHSAASWISDYDEKGVPMARHETVVLGETHGVRITFVTTLEAFDELRAAFDEIAGGATF